MRSIEGKLSADLASEVDEKYPSAGDGFPVETFRRLVEHTAVLSYLNKDHLFFYRGQDVDYRNKNDKSTFYPTIYRGGVLPKREVEHRFDILKQACAKLVDALEPFSKDGARELKRRKYVQWSILQHYGVCATPLVDFTHSLRVACSFALIDAEDSHAYVYVFGLPYVTNRITVNSEHDLVNVRLLSICPPEALRPYFQEGYLAATSDIDHEYDSKSELDFNRRLIVKFKIPNSPSFWGHDFSIIPRSALYPEDDQFFEICKDIELDVKRELKPGEIGEFLSRWSELEEFIVGLNSDHRERNTFFSSMKYMREDPRWEARFINDLDKLRRYRNQLVHSPKSIGQEDIAPYMELLSSVSNYFSAQTSQE